MQFVVSYANKFNSNNDNYCYTEPWYLCISDGNSKIGALVQSALGNIICLGHLSDRGQSEIYYLYSKIPFILHTYATCSELPSYYIYKYHA